MIDKICCGVLFVCGIDTLIVLNQPECNKIQVTIKFIMACIDFIWAINLLENILKR